MGSQFVSQLLPDLDQARILRTALNDFVVKEGVTEEQKDAAWELLAKLTKDMRRYTD